MNNDENNMKPDQNLNAGNASNNNNSSQEQNDTDDMVTIGTTVGKDSTASETNPNAPQAGETITAPEKPSTVATLMGETQHIETEVQKEGEVTADDNAQADNNSTDDSQNETSQTANQAPVTDRTPETNDAKTLTDVKIDGHAPAANNRSSYNAQPFEDFVEVGAMIPVPANLVDTVTSSLNKYYANGGFRRTGSQGQVTRMVANNDIYAGRITGISTRPIIFPANTNYGEQPFITLSLDNGLTVYIPQTEAGLTRPDNLTLMRDQLKSVVITALYDNSNNHANARGNAKELYAIGSITEAENQIGSNLQAEAANSNSNFFTYNRQGIITYINERSNNVIVTADLTREGRGYINVHMTFDELAPHYRWQRISDIPWVKLNAPVSFRFKSITREQINSDDRHGSYFRIEGTRQDLPEYRNRIVSALICGIGTGEVQTGYLYANSNRYGLLVEIAPGVIVGANLTHRISGDTKITKADIRNHARIYWSFDSSIHSPEDVRRVRRPVLINEIARDYQDHQVAVNNGSRVKVSREAIENLAQRQNVISNEEQRLSPSQRLNKVAAAFNALLNGDSEAPASARPASQMQNNADQDTAQGTTDTSTATASPSENDEPANSTASDTTQNPTNPQ